MAIAGMLIGINTIIKIKNELYQSTNWGHIGSTL